MKQQDKQIGWGRITLRDRQQYFGSLVERWIAGAGFISVHPPGYPHPHLFAATDVYEIQPLTEEEVKACFSTNFIEKIKYAVAVELNLRIEAIESKRRTDQLVVARAIIFRLARDCSQSLPTIARAFKRDHGTVLHNLNMLSSRLPHDRKIAEVLENLRARLNIPALTTPEAA